MKSFIVGSLAAASLIAGALINPSQAQTQTNQQQNQPGTGGTSKPGVQGLPGSKSGPTMKSTDPTATQRAAKPESSDQTSTPTKNQDESKVPGLPGGKSGPATKKE
jgi:hypothetical protein